MARRYYRLPDDGAKFRCVDCGELKSHTEVVQPVDEHGAPLQFGVICLECLDEDWFREATDLGLHR
jgi:hypothetical protein